MAGAFWSQEEMDFMVVAINNGRHPRQFIEELNQKFKRNRTPVSIEKKLGQLGISYAIHESKPEIRNSEEVSEINAYQQQIERLKGDLARTTRLWKEALRQVDVHDRILEAFPEVMGNLPAIKPPMPRKRKGKVTREDAVLCLSDIHWGEIVSGAATAGINHYDRDVANLRLKLIAEKACSIADDKLQGYNLQKLHLLMLGDMVCGTIHDELVAGATGDIVTWTTELAYVLYQMVLELLVVFPTIEIVGVYGNHGRLQ